ncbi:hypothetical protein J2129_001000 [Methanofollis sp. W23]|nr:hypothetical protein [Methanofollis sp. W23]
MAEKTISECGAPSPLASLLWGGRGAARSLAESITWRNSIDPDYEVIPKLSWGVHLLEPKHVLPEILNT